MLNLAPINDDDDVATKAHVAAIVAAALASFSAISAPARQTALAGPVDSNGLPNFWPATSGSLTLSTQNLATTPLVLSFADGFGTNGAVDRVLQISSDFSDTYPASATTYTFYDFTTGTRVLSSLPAIFTRGGALSTVNGQHTYDIPSGKMYVGNGSVALPVKRYGFGQVTTNASTVTSAICYAYAGRYVSPLTTFPSLLTPLILSHNLGIVPGAWTLAIVNTTAALAFSVGDELQDSSLIYTASPNNKVLSTSVSRLTATTIYSAAGGIFRKDGASFGAINTADWRLRLYANRGW